MQPSMKLQKPNHFSTANVFKEILTKFPMNPIKPNKIKKKNREILSNSTCRVFGFETSGIQKIVDFLSLIEL